ncbi:MAG TPA: hypothetical protein VF199_03205 [Bacillales bacterium]
MRLFIDNKFLIDSKALEETEKALNDWAGKHSGQVVWAYEWNGETNQDDWITFLNNKIQSEEKINLLTKPEVVLKQEMKDSVLIYCANVKEHLPPVIDGLFGTMPEKETGKLADLFEGLNFLISSVSLLNVGMDLSERNQAVIELSNAFESKDFVELADLLKYDWLPWVREYEKEIQTLHVGIS